MGGSLSYSSSSSFGSDIIGPSDGLTSPISLKNFDTLSRISDGDTLDGGMVVGMSKGLKGE
jgi:hypothetical protein